MLGKRVSDPHGMEGPAGEIEGLGLLDVATVLTAEKTLREVEGDCLVNGAPFQGYEMHVGETDGPDCARPLLRFADGRLDGAISADGRVAGAYVHGLFADDRQRAAWLAPLGAASEIAMAQRSRRRSTRSPTIARRISTATRCSRRRDDFPALVSLSPYDPASAEGDALRVKAPLGQARPRGAFAKGKRGGSRRGRGRANFWRRAGDSNGLGAKNCPVATARRDAGALPACRTA